MKVLHNFLRIVDGHTIVVIVLALISTYICVLLDFSANMPTGLIGIAVVFPIVFSINAAYRRREEALRYFASLKSHGLALCLAHRDWVPGSKDQTGPDHYASARELLNKLLTAIGDYFKAPPDEADQQLARVYKMFSRFSKSHEVIRTKKVPANEISRANQYLKTMMVEFEKMRNILLYRTPISLRAYSHFFLNVFPILFGPYFAHLVKDSNQAIGYVVAVIYSLVLVSLDNIQEDLENPFDLNGADDIRLDVAVDPLSVFDNDFCE